MFINELRAKHVSVINAIGDADVDIAKSAVVLSSYGFTTVIDQDTDLLVLLLYYVEDFKRKLIFPIRQGQMYSPIFHALTCCDITSQIYGIGKKAIFHWPDKNDHQLFLTAKQFIAFNPSPLRVTELAFKAVVILFAGESSEFILTMCSDIFSKILVTSSVHVTLEKMLPTKSAAENHARIFYIQVMTLMNTSKYISLLD